MSIAVFAVAEASIADAAAGNGANAAGNVDVTGLEAVGAVNTVAISGKNNVYPLGITATGEIGTPLIWNPVSDTQAPSWNVVNDSHHGIWTAVTDGNAVVWVEVTS